MGQLTPVHLAVAVIGVLLVQESNQEDRGGDEQTGNTKTSLEGDLRLLCDELEEEKYSQNRTLFKLKALQFLAANWMRFCATGNLFTLYENPLCWLFGLLILPVAAAPVLAHYCYNKRSRKVKKILEAKTERLKPGGAIQDLADDNHNNQDPIRENSPLPGSEETQTKELARFTSTEQLPPPPISTMQTFTTPPTLRGEVAPRQLVNMRGEVARCTVCAALNIPCTPSHCRTHQPVWKRKQVREMQLRKVNPFVKKSNCTDCQEELVVNSRTRNQGQSGFDDQGVRRESIFEEAGLFGI